MLLLHHPSCAWRVAAEIFLPGDWRNQHLINKVSCRNCHSYEEHQFPTPAGSLLKQPVRSPAVCSFLIPLLVFFLGCQFDSFGHCLPCQLVLALYHVSTNVEWRIVWCLGEIWNNTKARHASIVISPSPKGCSASCLVASALADFVSSHLKYFILPDSNLLGKISQDHSRMLQTLEASICVHPVLLGSCCYRTFACHQKVWFWGLLQTDLIEANGMGSEKMEPHRRLGRFGELEVYLDCPLLFPFVNKPFSVFMPMLRLNRLRPSSVAIFVLLESAFYQRGSMCFPNLLSSPCPWGSKYYHSHLRDTGIEMGKWLAQTSALFHWTC